MEPEQPRSEAPAPVDYDALAARAVQLGFAGLVPMVEALEEIGRTIDTQPETAPVPVSEPEPIQQEIIMSETSPSPSASAPAAAPQPAPPAAAPIVAPQPASAPVAQPAPPPHAQPAGPPPQDPANERALPEHVRKRMAQQNAQATQRYTALQQQHAAEAARAAQLEQQVAATQEELRLKLELAQAGVKDIDFAWFELSKQLKALAADKSPEGVKKLAEFQAAAWAEEQRASRPYIFGTQSVPATTGAVGAPGTQPAPPQPTPGQVAGAAAGAGTFNALTASPKEFEAQMRARGIPYVGAKPHRG